MAVSQYEVLAAAGWDVDATCRLWRYRERRRARHQERRALQRTVTLTLAAVLEARSMAVRRQHFTRWRFEQQSRERVWARVLAAITTEAA